MGWLVKVGAVIVGLICLNVLLWPVSLVCFGYLGYTVWAASRKRRVYVMDKTGGSAAPQPKKQGLFKKRYIAAGLFFLLAVIAAGERGTLSPIVFSLIGAVIVASGFLRFGPRRDRMEAIPDSILLRNRLLPL